MYKAALIGTTLAIGTWWCVTCYMLHAPQATPNPTPTPNP